MRYKRYNIDNLIPFTKDTASYYGKIGGFNSGKSKLKNKIDTTKYTIYLLVLELEDYKDRKRFYKKDLEFIKSQLHYIKIRKNRLNKLIEKYNKKYNDSESQLLNN